MTSGQVIGFSGGANGAPHLHVACMLGDPETKLLSGKLPPGAPKAAGGGADVP